MMRQLGVIGLIAVLGSAVQAQPVFRQAATTRLVGSTLDYVATLIVEDVGRPGGGPPDGKPDALALNNASQIVVTMAGKGDGTFVRISPNTTVSSSPASFALGDFTNDGILDLLVGDDLANAVTFYLGGPNGPPYGTGGASVAVGVVPAAIVTADVNQDSNLDAIVVGQGPGGQGTITVLFGNGGGTFTAGAPVNAGLRSTGAAVGNFDNDLFPDVAVANADSDSVTVFRNTGTGAFAVAETKTVGRTPTSIAAGELNGDGRVDLVVVNSDADSVSVLIGLGGARFDDAQTYTSGSEGSAPRGVALADVDGDGQLDALTANRISLDVSVMLGDGHGHLGRPRGFVSDLEPMTVAAGDLNGDGLADSVTVNAADEPSLAALLALPDSNGGLTGVEDVFTVQNPMGLAIGDADDNGVADMVVGPSVGGPGALQVFLAQAAGGFAAPVTMTPAGGVAAVAYGNFTGSGVLDVAVANKDADSVSVFRNAGLAQFGAPVNTAIGAGTVGVTVGDWNRDGRADLAVARQANGVDGALDILLGKVDGTFTVSTLATVGQVPAAIDHGDFDNDGFLDLVVANGSTKNLTVWYGAGNGTFAASTPVALSVGPLAVTVADFDQDGFDDLATVTVTPSRLLLFYGNGQRAFAAGQTAAVAAGAGVASRDLTGDLIPDLLVTAVDGSSNLAMVFVNPGDRTPFREIQDFMVSRGPMPVTTGDVDGDGRYDGELAYQLVSSASVLTNIRATPVLRGDGNADGRVSAADILAVFRELPENPTGRIEVIGRGAYKPGAGIDANGDGLVTAQDTAGTIAWNFGAF